MRIYNKYILFLLLSSFVGILLLLSGILWITQSLRIVDLIINKGIDLLSFFRLSLLLLPYLAFIIMPIAVFCVTLLIANRLLFDREIIVLKSSGCSNMQTLKPFISFGIIATLFSYLLSLYIMPLSYHYFKLSYHDYKNNFAALHLEEGIFSSKAGNFTVYIDHKTKDNAYKGVIVYDTRVPQSPKVILASQGRVINKEGSIWFELLNGSHQEHKAGSIDDLRILFFDRYMIEMNLLSGIPLDTNREPSEKFLHELLQSEPGEDNNGIAKKHSNLHFRILWPLCCFILCLIPAAYLILSPYQRYHRQMINIAITFICLLYIVLFLLLNNFKPAQPLLASIQYLFAGGALIIPNVIILRS